jgi:glucose/mannose transport system permease protein
MAILLAGLRGVDPDILKAARVDGLSAWRVYLQVIAPMLGGSFATATILLSTSVVRLYDLSVAMTNGGPGIASEVPAKFVMDHLFERGNIGLATAAATSMLATIAAVLVPWFVWQNHRAQSGRHG